MKKLGLVLCAVLVIFGSVALVADAASPQQKWNEFCKWWEDNNPDYFPFKNHGDCVSALASELNNSGPAKFCQKYWDAPFFQWWFGWKNQGDCVSDLRN